MFKITSNLIFFINIYSFVNGFTFYEDKLDCRNISSGKKPGHSYFSLGHKISNETPNSTLNESNLTNCASQCIRDLDCQIAVYNKDTQNCKLYYNFYKAEVDEIENVFYWHFCDLSIGTDNKELAQGFWFYNKDYQIETNYYIVNNETNFLNCKGRCRINPLCGGFNYYEKSSECQLIEIWYIESIYFKPCNGCRGYYWVLQNPITYKVENEYCRYIKTKVYHGKWKIYKPKNKINYLAMVRFKTRNFTRCYKSCEYYEACDKIIFQYSTSTCILQGLSNPQCAKNIPIPIYEIINVHWERCYKKMTMELSYNNVISSSFRKCYEIRNSSYVTLLPYKCFKVLDDVKENCRTKHKKYSINCYYNQCFQSTGKTINNYLIIFNGYQTFLLKNASKSNFISSTYACCELYNAVIPKHPQVSIISPQDWYTININETNKAMILPAKTILVGVLNHARCLCFEWLHCVEEIRFVQKNIYKTNHINIPFHFMISPNGKIFEGRGWQIRNKVKNIRDSETYYFGFIGNYYSNTPTIASMQSFKNLIAYGVLNKYIDENYNLITDHDYKPKQFQSTHFKLYNVIRAQARYNNLKKEDCLQISYLTISFNIFCTFAITFLIFLLSKFLYRLGHTKVCNNLRRCNDEQYLLNLSIYPTSNYMQVLLNYNQEFKDFIKKETCFLEILNTTIFWITDLSERLKCTYCARKTQQYFAIHFTCHRNFNVLKLKLMKHCCKKETICLIFPTQSAFLKTIFVIVHLESFDIVVKLKNIISSIINGKCICSNFEVNKMKIKMIGNSFQII